MRNIKSTIHTIKNATLEILTKARLGKNCSGSYKRKTWERTEANSTEKERRGDGPNEYVYCKMSSKTHCKYLGSVVEYNGVNIVWLEDGGEGQVRNENEISPVMLYGTETWDEKQGLYWMGYRCWSVWHYVHCNRERLGAKTIKKNTNSTQNKCQTHRAKQYEVTSFLSTDCELSTETCSKNVYSLGPRSKSNM